MPRAHSQAQIVGTFSAWIAPCRSSDERSASPPHWPPTRCSRRCSMGVRPTERKSRLLAVSFILLVVALICPGLLGPARFAPPVSIPWWLALRVRGPGHLLEASRTGLRYAAAGKLFEQKGMRKNSLLVCEPFGLVLFFRSRQGCARKGSPGRPRMPAAMRLVGGGENSDPTLRVVFGSSRQRLKTIEVIFPEHVTVRLWGPTGGKASVLFRQAARRSDLLGARVAGRCPPI